MELSKTVRDIRVNWAKSDAARDAHCKQPEEIVAYRDISYGPFGEFNLLDVYVGKQTSEIQPTIVNIHGGGWVYGSKEIYQYYCMDLAMRGFTVVNINYRLAPEERFPAAVEDINAALTWVEKEGAKYFADKNRIILIGDSAGGQLVSHYACVATNKDFASLFDFTVPNINIKALGLNCGAYNGRNMAMLKRDEVFNEYLDIMETNASEELLEKVDTISNITENYPPSFVMSAVHDFLLPDAKPMYEKLVESGVPAHIQIYGAEDKPEIGHVFHIAFWMEESKRCNDDEVEFFKKFV